MSKRKKKKVQSSMNEYYTAKEYLAMKGIDATPEEIEALDALARETSKKLNIPIRCMDVEAERESVRKIRRARVENLLQSLSNGK